MEVVASWERLKLKATEIRQIMRKAMARWVERILSETSSAAHPASFVWTGLVGENPKAVNALSDGVQKHSDLNATLEPIQNAWKEQNRLFREQTHKKWLDERPAREAAEQARFAKIESEAKTTNSNASVPNPTPKGGGFSM